jgi:SAM-dependent methyltransferase
MTPTENEEQIKYWNGVAGDKWTANQEILDRVLSPIGVEIIARGKPARGERVIDVGCGCGDTTLTIGKLVAPEGKVLGVDISLPMLARARERAAGAALPVDFQYGDAAVHDFAREEFDLLFSRFGVMFFENPVRAFSNLHKALKSGGRLAFSCWRPMKENPWIMTPIAGALAVLAAHNAPPPEPTPPRAPGPFAFAEADYVQSILRESGFRNVTIAPFDATLQLGNSLEEALQFTLEIGPVSRLIAELPEALRDDLKAGVRAALQRAQGADGLRLAAATWMVSAEA